MRAGTRKAVSKRLVALTRRRRVQTAATFGLVVLGPLLAATTFLMLGPLEQGARSPGLRLTLLADLVYVLVVAALILSRVARMVAARRAHSAGSRLHLRLTMVFALIALIPTVLVAIFAGLTINVGLEGWFSDRVRRVVGASLDAAEAYEREQRDDLAEDAEALARYLTRARENTFALGDGELRQILNSGQRQIQRGLKEAYVIDGTGDIRARGERSYLFDYEQPAAAQLQAARSGETVISEDWDHNEFRALVALDSFVDRYLTVSRQVDGELLSLLDETQATARFYRQLESERGRLVFEFGLLYLGFALILILAAIWMGLWLAGRLSRPVGQLAEAAQRVGEGDLEVQVRASKGDDEIATLGRVFNAMTRELKAQREALLETNRQIERRRRLFDSVLSSVTAGVVGLDPSGRVTFVNRSAQRLLKLPDEGGQSAALTEAVPEFGPLFARLRTRTGEVAQEEIKLSRGGTLENLLVRMATRRGEDGQLEGYVVAFDDVTDLVAAQRMAAWGDVARRIAHEIKNPLTPIQLSAERLRRKLRPLLAEGEAAEALDNNTEVIVRQTGDLRRIVDEFSKFARMPQPERQLGDLVDVVRDAVRSQETALEGIAIATDLPGTPMTAELDAGMLTQAFTNLIKNGGEAIVTYQETYEPHGYAPEIRVTLEQQAGMAVVRIADNGIGLPEDRGRLFEPYVTTREKGTGLGLPIVRKIIEEHGGTLTLTDAPAFDATGRVGAMAEIRLPLADTSARAAE